MSTYANLIQFQKTYPNFVIQEGGQQSLENLLQQAERDIDLALGPGAVQQGIGLKIHPDRLSEYRRDCLARATSHQAIYRMTKGDSFFISFRPESQSGPNGSIQGQEPFIAPQAAMELTAGRLYDLVRGHGRRNVYDLPNQNIDQEPW